MVGFPSSSLWFRGAGKVSKLGVTSRHVVQSVKESTFSARASVLVVVVAGKCRASAGRQSHIRSMCGTQTVALDPGGVVGCRFCSARFRTLIAFGVPLPSLVVWSPDWVGGWAFQCSGWWTPLTTAGSTFEDLCFPPLPSLSRPCSLARRHLGRHARTPHVFGRSARCLLFAGRVIMS